MKYPMGKLRPVSGKDPYGWLTAENICETMNVLIDRINDLAQQIELQNLEGELNDRKST